MTFKDALYLYICESSTPVAIGFLCIFVGTTFLEVLMNSKQKRMGVIMDIMDLIFFPRGGHLSSQIRYYF